MNKEKSVLSKLFVFAKKFKVLIIIGMILSGISAVISIFPIIFIWLGVKEIFEMYPNVVLTDSLIHNAWMAVVVAVLGILLYTIALMLTHIAAFRIAKIIRKTTLKHVMTLPLGFFSQNGSGKLRKVINDSASSTEAYLAHQLPDLVGAYVTPLAVLVILFVFDWKLGLISLIPMAIAVVAMMSGMGKDQASRMQEYQSSLEEMNNEATEYVRGIPIVKTFNQSVFSFERFNNVINSYKEKVSEYSYRMRIPMTLFQNFLVSTPVFLVLSSILIVSGQINRIDFFLSLFFYLIFTPICALMLMKIMWVMQTSMLANDAINRIENILSINPLPISDNPDEPKNSNIEIKNISFSYPNSKQKAINNISLNIKQGQTVALVGPSGGGKTTLATLIARFWDVESGDIEIGGVNVTNITNENLMKNISFVFQNTNLYKSSILDNLREGKKEATIDEVNQALKAARCEEIIAKLPNGIETVYGTKGVYLSSGEAQRIALARAILKDAPIVLLDEATAFADPENEYQIQSALSELTKNKTVVVIAHRLSTIKNVDCIYVVENGKIIQQGTHQQLSTEEGLYSAMWKEYNDAFLWNEKENN